MKAFVAFRFTGEDPKLLEPLLNAACDALKARDIDAYCTILDEEQFRSKGYTRQQILEHAFEIIAASDFLFVLQTSDKKSEGMLMEVGYCLAKKIPVVAAQKNHVEGSLVSDVASKRLYWDDIPDLVEKIGSFDFTDLVSAQ